MPIPLPDGLSVDSAGLESLAFKLSSSVFTCISSQHVTQDRED
jgi:hypothetical protein